MHRMIDNLITGLSLAQRPRGPLGCEAVDNAAAITYNSASYNHPDIQSGTSPASQQMNKATLATTAFSLHEEMTQSEDSFENVFAERVKRFRKPIEYRSTILATKRFEIADGQTKLKIVNVLADEAELLAQRYKDVRELDAQESEIQQALAKAEARGVAATESIPENSEY